MNFSRRRKQPLRISSGALRCPITIVAVEYEHDFAGPSSLEGDRRIRIDKWSTMITNQTRGSLSSSLRTLRRTDDSYGDFQAELQI